MCDTTLIVCVSKTRENVDLNPKNLNSEYGNESELAINDFFQKCVNLKWF